MGNRQTLLDAILEEDRLLRRRLTTCPAHLREVRGPTDALSFKETLAHLSFWDNFTVEFFTRKLDASRLNPDEQVDFEAHSRQALAAAADLPFGEVLARYLESTGALTRFLTLHWDALSPRQRNDFRVPLKHRRQHRIGLFAALDMMEGARGMAAEA